MFAQTYTPGFSGEAQYIEAAADEQNRALRYSAAIGNQAAIDELGAVWDECQAANWDGYDAQPVTQETLVNAYRLLDSLPWNAPAPTIGAEPDGQLTLEWRRSRRRTLSVSVTEDGNLHYAGLFGPNRQYGTIAFFGDVPPEITQLVEQVYGG
jgi:hypothetical protein